MKVYIAGKISGLERRDVLLNFARAERLWLSRNCAVFNPTVLPEFSDVLHEDYLHICFAMIDICDTVYMLSNWRESKGARLELQYAADWHKKILYEDESTREKDFPIVH